MKWMYYSILVFAVRPIKATSAICWGPPLWLDLPIRYLHVQLTESSPSRNLTSSAGPLRVSARGDEEYCRVRVETVDRFDGSYVVRLRLMSRCRRLVLDVRSPFDEPICGSPILVEKGNGDDLMPEECDCARYDLNDWLRLAGCPATKPQIEMDLARWEQNIDFKQTLDRARTIWMGDEHRYSIAICHYRIRDNQLSRACYGEYTGFKMFSDAMFTSLMRKMRLPDVDFLVNLGDYPLEMSNARSPATTPAAVFSWCGHPASRGDIVMPTYELTQSVLGAITTVTLDIHTARGTEHVPWGRKKSTAVFRGRDSRQERLDLVDLAVKRPDLIEAGITRYFFFEQGHPPVEQRPFHHFFRHRYVLSLDGTVAAYRLPFLLAGDSVVLKQDSPYYEHFYSEMRAWVHFVPFDLANLESRLQALQSNETFAKEVIANARQFVNDHLQPIDIFCYYALLIKKYTEKLQQQANNVVDDDDAKMEHVTTSAGCSCKETNNGSNQLHEEL